MNYAELGNGSKGHDANCGMAFYMTGKPTVRVYEDELRKAFMKGDQNAGVALDTLLAWKWRFLEGNYSSSKKPTQKELAARQRKTNLFLEKPRRND